MSAITEVLSRTHLVFHVIFRTANFGSSRSATAGAQYAMATRQAMLVGLVAAGTGLAVWLVSRQKGPKKSDPLVQVERSDPLVEEALCTFVSAAYADLILQKCLPVTDKRVGELTPDEITKIIGMIRNPKPFRTPPALYLDRH